MTMEEYDITTGPGKIGAVLGRDPPER